MTNSKKRLFTVLSLIVVMCLTIFTLSACANTDSVVKFMVQENGEWKENSQVKAVDGAVEAPEAPAKEYYTFAGWYLDDEFKTAFDASKVDASVSVYAKYTPIEATIVMDGINKGNKKLLDVKANNAGIVAKEGLTFDGWYKDANCQVKWNGEADVQTLYARSIAKLTFNNSYEDIYTVDVVPGSIFADPAKQNITVDGVETTLEASFLKDYMSDKNLDYVDAEGVAIDFTKPIDKNAVITVLWNSKIDDSAYKLNAKTNNYYLQPASLPDAPVISLRSDITIMVQEGDTEVAKDITVEAIEAYATMGFIKPTVKKIIFGEGFKSIKGISGDGACLVEEVVIPSTTKIIDNSFNNMPMLKGVEVPEGVEAIICSFLKKTGGDRRSYYIGEGYDFNINIPASVKNMAMVTNNFTFAEGSTFSKDNGYIYQATEKGKVLVYDPNSIASYDAMGRPEADTIIVPECDGIQAGTYSTAFNYLMLPASFKFVNYNLNLADNTFYISAEGSDWANTNNMLYDVTAKDAPATTMNGPAYAISNNLGGFTSLSPTWQPIHNHSGKVVFATDAVPTELDKFAFAGDTVGRSALNGQFQAMTDETLKTNVILNDAVNKAYITTTFDGETVNLELTESTLNANTIKDAIVAKLSADAQAKINKGFKSVKFFEKGVEVALGEVKSDMFLTMEISLARLTVSSSWRVGHTGMGYSASDYEKPEEATKFIDGTVKLEKFDLTDMTEETLKAELFALAIESANNDDIISFGAPESAVLEANMKYFYDNAVSVKYIANGERITDLSKITLDNGEVQLEIVYEFK